MGLHIRKSTLVDFTLKQIAQLRPIQGKLAPSQEYKCCLLPLGSDSVSPDPERESRTLDISTLDIRIYAHVRFNRKKCPRYRNC